MQEKERLYFEMLVQSLQLLAAQYNEQVQALPSFVHVPDEIALIFSDTWLIYQQYLIENVSVSPSQEKEIEQLNTMLDKMSDNSHLWSMSSLQSSALWEEVRMNAQNILKSLHKERKQPDLFWLKYIPQ